MADILDVLCSVEYDPELECIISSWHGYASSNQFRAICERALDLVKKHNVKKGISDNRGMSIIAAPDQEWVLKDYLPRVLETGYYASATILPTDHFAKVSLDEISSKISGKEIKQKYFDNISDAKEWIRTV